jgi:acyl-CoA dehydrogenase
MDFTPDPDEELIREAIRAVCGRFDDAYWAERDARHEFPWEFYAAMADGGWVGIAIPEAYGGGGRGINEASLVLEEVAASGAAMNGCSSMHLTIFGINVVVRNGSERQREEILPAVVRGDLHVCFAVTEPDAGTDTTRIRTEARREGSSYVIRGRKIWISKAADAQKMVLVTRTTPREQAARPTDGMTLFLVDVDKSAMDIRPIPKMGRNAVASNEVLIEGLRVPESARIGEEGQGFRYLLDGLNPERILLAHEAIGIGRAALRRAVQYAKEREVFGRPIGKNQGIAFPLAEATARLEAAALVARKAAWLYDRGLPCGAEANMAKWLCADAGFQAADAAVQTHGGMGYAREFHVERYFREARLLRLVPISQEMALAHLAQHLLGLPRSY